MRLFTHILTCSVMAASLWSTSSASAGGCFGGLCHGSWGGWNGYSRPYYSTPSYYNSGYYNNGYYNTTYTAPVAPVAPAAPVAPPPVAVPSGAKITLAGHFGTDGDACLRIGDVKLPMNVEAWSPTGIVATLPALKLQEPQRANIEVVSFGGRSELIPVILSPAPRLVVLEEAPAGGNGIVTTPATVVSVK